ncbi:MAG: class I SAM-dependent methyltransferase, partial [Phycisphaerae bacterium]
MMTRPDRRISRMRCLGVVAAIVMAAGVAASGCGAKRGINDSFKGDVDVARFVGVFEGESREIYRDRMAITAAVGIRTGDVVADIGAGTGFFTLLFARAAGPNGEAIGVDIAPQFLEHIQNRAKAEGVTNIRTVECAEDSVGLPPASVNLVFICDTYHHFEYPERTMQSIHSALKPGGEVVVIDFNRIEGQSRPWVMDHVRCGKDQTIREIETAGFKLIPHAPTVATLTDNFLIRFRKVG